MDANNILLLLVQGEEGKEWARGKLGWEKYSPDPVCDWDGITCESEDISTLFSISFHGTKISGTLPPELGKLTTLKRISLSQGSLRGPIPSEIAQLPHLEVLDLARNQITGSLPAFRSPNLRYLNLGYNQLFGTLPTDFGVRHERLTDLILTNNGFSGQIPFSLQHLHALVKLSFSENFFSGTIPSEIGFGCLSLLRYLFLDNNHLMGTIPSAIAHSDSSLIEFWVHKNMLSGTIPASFGDISSLESMYIDGNKFTGSVPPDLCRQDINVDFFHNVKDEAAKRDYCQSIACPTNYVAIEGVYPCRPCFDRGKSTSSKYYNPYLGRTGACIDLNQRDILSSLYISTNGEKWIALCNWNIENGFLCDFAGITCDINHHITDIDLKGCGLRGTIPESIGFLPHLQNLDLSDNDLWGYLPSDLRWAPLETLDVSGNRLRGIVPNMLCREGGINGNGELGDYNCENIACPVGYFSKSGRHDIANSDTCRKCADVGSRFLGMKRCREVVVIKHQNKGGNSLVIWTFLTLIFITYCYWRRRNRRRFGHELLPKDDDDFLEITSRNKVNAISSERRSTIDPVPDPFSYVNNNEVNDDDADGMDNVTMNSSESDEIVSDEEDSVLSTSKHVQLQRLGHKVPSFKKSKSRRSIGSGGSLSTNSRDGIGNIASSSRSVRSLDNGRNRTSSSRRGSTRSVQSLGSRGNGSLSRSRFFSSRSNKTHGNGEHSIVSNSSGSSSSSRGHNINLSPKYRSGKLYSTIEHNDDDWSVDGETTKEDWLDVPKMSHRAT